MSCINYSQWDHIEVSDDEDDTHPNIDTPSLFKWRHDARIERDKQFQKEKEEFTKSYQKHLNDFSALKKTYREAQENSSPNLATLEEEWKKMLKVDEDWQNKQSEFKKKEKLRPQNVDTLCHEGKSYTAINSYQEKLIDEEADTEEVVEKLKNFVDTHGKEIKEYGMFQKPTDTRKYLLEHPYLVCDETANHLLLWCIELAMEEKFELMNHVSHQCIVMQFMLELRKAKKYDQRALITLFFEKLIHPEPDYKKAFDDELVAFRKRIRDRAKVRLEEATEKYEEEERQKRLGPGGLDPLDVMNELPDELKECFEKRDTELLKEVFGKMDKKEAFKWYTMCVDSGLWIENANDLKADEEVSEDKVNVEEDDSEEIIECEKEFDSEEEAADDTGAAKKDA